MSYSKERDEFIARATAEGLPLHTVRTLLRYASTLQRLAVAQCNGDYPYNGDRDRPSAYREPCAMCCGRGHYPIGTVCPQCNGNRDVWKRDTRADERHDKRYTVCPRCETSGVDKNTMRFGSEGQRVCPDCRTQDLTRVVLQDASQEYWKSHDLATRDMDMKPRRDFPFVPVFGGDPRGAVLRLSTPNYPCNESSSYGLYVPARER